MLMGGEIDCWGYNGGGELGSNDTINRAIPTMVTGRMTGDAHCLCVCVRARVCVPLRV